MLRRALIPDYETAGVAPDADDAYNFSMWDGYRSDPSHAEVRDWCRGVGKTEYIHTSGHASPADLRAFTAAIKPKLVVPVHGLNSGEQTRGFGNVRALCDGEQFAIP